jgi:hypothetical protein
VALSPFEEEHMLKVFKNMVLKMFGPKRDMVNGE